MHLSEVTSASKHDRLSWSSEQAFHELAKYIPERIPIVLESVIPATEVRAELERAVRTLPIPQHRPTAQTGEQATIPA